MSPSKPDQSPQLIAVRQVLLDALDALQAHQGSLVLIGAQAIYLHAGAGSLDVPPTTTDADLAIDADLLADDPNIVEALTAAGFTLGSSGQPGHWVNPTGLAVDLMVAPHQAGRPAGARSARLSPHPRQTGRIAPGLAAALTGNSLMESSAFDPADHRRHTVKIAGPAALLVAKTIKITYRLADAERGQSARVIDKDALDILRLLQEIPTTVLTQGLRRHPSGSPADNDVQTALAALDAHATTPTAVIPQLALRAANGDPAVPASLAALVNALLATVRGDRG